MNLKARLWINSQRVYKGTVGDVYFAEFASLIYVQTYNFLEQLN